MIKYLTFPAENRNGPTVEVIGQRSGLVKTASHELHPNIRKFVDNPPKDPNKIYVLINALGAGEYYGPNSNNDYFEESELKKEASDHGYKSFLKAGNYRHHKNKDPEKSIGDVEVAEYNDKMHRVELVVGVKRDKARFEGHGDLITALDNNEKIATSMGAKVPYDVCSVCKNKAKTKADYCNCMKKQAGHVMDDGKRVYVTNPRPRFFDISFVTIGADRTSHVMHKLASTGVLSVDSAEEHGIRDPDGPSVKVAVEKRSEIIKKIRVIAEKIPQKGKLLDKKCLKKVAAYPMDAVVSTTGTAGIILAPIEFQTIALHQLGMSKLAEHYYDTNTVFTPSEEVETDIWPEKLAVDNLLILDILPFVSDRSVYDPVSKKRTLTKEAHATKISSEKYKSSNLLDKVASAYNGYRISLLANALELAEKAVTTPRLYGEINKDRFEDALVFDSQGKTSSAVNPALALMGIIPLALLYGAYAKRSRGGPVSSAKKFAKDHPVFTTSMLIGLARLGGELAKKGGLDAKLLNVLARF